MLTVGLEVAKVISCNMQRCTSTFVVDQKLLNRFAQDNTSVQISN